MFQGHTSWQTSQPNTQSPVPFLRSSGTESRFSMVWYEMQRRASTTYGRGKAPVGHEGRQLEQSPQKSACGWSYGSQARSITSAASRTQLPWLRVIKQPFLPIQPRPASRAQAFSAMGPQSTEPYVRTP